MQRFLLLLRSNWISATGGVVTTLSFMAFVTTFIFLMLHGSAHGPYVGLFAFVALPMTFVLGLILIPVGLLIYRGRLRERIELLKHKPFRLIRLLGLLTLVNLAVVGTGGYEALHYMDSQQFCGTLCHQVMSPTYDAYVTSPHARVACVECHIGPGASWFVKSKMSGLRQVIAVILGTYQKPIPTPVHNLRPARDTCEQCHWPDRFTGDRVVIRQHYGDDETASPETTVLVLKTGGRQLDGRATGIHWHVHPGNRVTYYSPEGARQKIPWIRWTDDKGNERVFTTEEFEGKTPPQDELRTMDCVDCHNQPSHAFQDAEAAVDQAITAGLISRDLPFVRKLSLDALKLQWTKDTVAAGIEKHLRDSFAKVGGLPATAADKIAPAVDALATIWRRNIHPEMNITWGTYPNFQGHTGCMRCHDGNHADKDGEAINFDCGLCHATLADRSKDPEILERLGLKSH